jgi:hypothetical protein
MLSFLGQVIHYFIKSPICLYLYTYTHLTLTRVLPESPRHFYRHENALPLPCVCLSYQCDRLRGLQYIFYLL